MNAPIMSTKKIRIKVDPERLSKEVTLDQFIAMQEGNLKAIREVMGLFIVENGHYLPPDEGRILIGSLTLEKLNEAVQEFSALAEEAAVPFGSSKESASP